MFANASSMPQVVEFYMSLLWVYNIFFGIVFFIGMFYISFIKKGYCDHSFFMIIIVALFFGIGFKILYDYYIMGKILEEGYSAFNMVLHVNLISKLNIGIWISILQMSVSMLYPTIIAFYITLPYTLFIKFKGLNNKK